VSQGPVNHKLLYYHGLTTVKKIGRIGSLLITQCHKYVHNMASTSTENQGKIRGVFL